MTGRSVTRAIIIAAAIALSGIQAGAAESFFQGKTIRLNAHTAPGGGYDSYVRLLARHIGKHIPGNPTVIAQNQVGAGGLLAVNHLAKIAPQDGTSVTLVPPALLTHQVTEQPGLEISLAKLKWVGNLTQANNVFVTSPKAEAKTIEDAKTKEVRVGATGVGAASAQLPWAYNALLGTKFKVILGYKGSGEFDLAIERGELDGRNVTSFPSYIASLPEQVRPNINVLIQLGTRKDPALPEVPLLLDLVKGDPKKEPVARFLSLAFSSINRPFATGPNVPDDRVNILRRAFDATMQDPEFIADSHKMSAEIDPMNGEETQAAIEEILSFPKDVIERVQAVLTQPK